MVDRIGALKNLISETMDGYLVTDEKNMLYLTGFSGGSKLLIPLKGEGILFAHSVNFEAAKERVKNVSVELVKAGEDSDKKVADEANRLRIRRIGFDALSFSTYTKLKNYHREIELEATGDVLWTLRKVKDEEEQALLMKAAELTSDGMRKAFEVAEAGVREREVAAEIEYEMRRLGSDGVAFDTLVSSGPSSAFPHGGCGDRRLSKGDFVVIDIGAKYRDYCADLTRTLLIGKPSSKQAEMHETVRKAQELAIAHVRAGIEAKKIDDAARRHIAQMGYGEYFVHSLGHGVGLDVHELPILGPSSKDELASGNTVTVEPGIYIPKLGGIRIEDTVLVLDNKAEKLTDAPLASF